MATTTSTTVDNLNVLDSLKTNDVGGLKVITWADISNFLTSNTNATQTATMQQAFANGQLFLTFYVESLSSYYTIGHSTSGYLIRQNAISRWS